MANKIEDFKALEIIALKSREKPDFDAEFRKLCRWFSKEFSTPLKDVEEMDIHYLLLHKYEAFIGNLSEEDYLKFKNRILYPERIEEKENEDEDWFEGELKKALESEQKKLKDLQKDMNELNLTEDTEDIDIQF